MKIDQDTILLGLALMLVFILIFRTGKSFADQVNPPLQMATASPVPMVSALPPPAPPVMLGAGATAQCAPPPCPSCPVCPAPPPCPVCAACPAPPPPPSSSPAPAPAPAPPSQTRPANAVTPGKVKGYTTVPDVTLSGGDDVPVSDADSDMLINVPNLQFCGGICNKYSQCRGFLNFKDGSGTTYCALKSSTNTTPGAKYGHVFYARQ